MNDLTDHLPNFLIINKFSTLSNNIKIFQRDYSKLNESALINDIQSVELEEIFSSSSIPDPNTMFDLFYDKISKIVDLHIPVKQLSKREVKIQSKPWITPGIRVSIRVKNRLFKKFLSTQSTYYHSKFKYYRNKLNHILRISKRQYYNDYFATNIKDSKEV